MRRLTFIFGFLFALTTAGAWGSNSSGAHAFAPACSHEENASSAMMESHDCCRAHVGAPAHMSEHHAAPHHAPEATREHRAHEEQAARVDPQTNCEKQEAARATKGETKAAAFNEAAPACPVCCAGDGRNAPTTISIAAPQPNKVKRVPVNFTTADAQHLHRTSAANLATLAFAPHTPPPGSPPLHILHSVFLI